jgi:hypothetical protein
MVGFAVGEAAGERGAQADEHAVVGLPDGVRAVAVAAGQAGREFVRSFVEAGGQGWSAFIDPEFYVMAAAQGVIAEVTWISFKKAMTRTLRSLRLAPGPTPDLTPGGSLEPAFERQLSQPWERAQGLTQGQNIDHTMDEASALHWMVFSIELQRELKSVKLRPDHYERISRAAAATVEQLTPDQLVARIIEQWLRSNPDDNEPLSS